MPRPKSKPTRKAVNLRMRIPLHERLEQARARQREQLRRTGLTDEQIDRVLTFSDVVERAIEVGLDAIERGEGKS